MAKTKSGSSAAQRREQQRQQRQSNNTTTQQQNQRGRRTRQQKQRNSNWIWVTATLILVAAIIGVFVYLSHQPAPSSAASGSSTKEVMQNITNIDPSSLTTVGTGGVQNPMKAVSGATPLVGSNGKPEFFYAGAEYCPYCAAQRWSMIVALSRFGTFTGVSEITSSESNLSTFSFHGSHYTSQYVDFVPVELYDNQNKPLETPTSAEQKLIQTYDSPPYVDASSTGAIPFLDIANKFVSTGAYYSATDISGLSWTDISGQVQNTNTKVSKDILGAANYLTAAICAATNNQPASVCSAAPITQIEPTLPKVSYNGGHGQLALASYTGDIIETKRNI